MRFGCGMRGCGCMRNRRSEFMSEAIKFWEDERDGMWATPSIKANAQLVIDALKKAKPGVRFIVCRNQTYGGRQWCIVSTTTGRVQSVPVAVKSDFFGTINTTAIAFESKGAASVALSRALIARDKSDFA